MVSSFAYVVIISNLLRCYISSSSPIDSLWPIPSETSFGDQVLCLNGNFGFQAEGNSKRLQRAVERYTLLIGAKGDFGDRCLNSCTLSVDSEDAPLSLGTDESYTLKISSGRCTINANTIWGAMYGMETFTQLLTRGSDARVLLHGAPLEIEDSPRFTHRGLLIDTSRHFFTVKSIKTLIDSISISKMNILHWHMVDAQSFPLQPTDKACEKLGKGAYSPSLTYSLDDVTEVVDYALDRGVRIIPEIDVPGHAASYVKGYPEIMADCFQKYYYNINDFALNPAVPKTYEVLEGLVTDVVKSSKSSFLHLGGDEVVYGCWDQDKSILQYKQENGITSDNELLGIFVEKVQKIAISRGATPVHWEEVFKAGLADVVSPQTIFQVWTGAEFVSQCTAAGFRTVASPSEVWYLDHADNTWDVMFNYDPSTNLTSSQQALLLGGEVTMWTEHVDATNYLQWIHPRSNAVAERLWSFAQIGKATTDSDAFSDAVFKRLSEHRCRLVDRGIPAAPLGPGFCAQTYV